MANVPIFNGPMSITMSQKTRGCCVITGVGGSVDDGWHLTSMTLVFVPSTMEARLQSSTSLLIARFPTAWPRISWPTFCPRSTKHWPASWLLNRAAVRQASCLSYEAIARVSLPILVGRLWGQLLQRVYVVHSGVVRVMCSRHVQASCSPLFVRLTRVAPNPRWLCLGRSCSPGTS